MPPRNTTQQSLGLTQSSQIENMLNDRGFTWEFRTGIGMGEFDVERSLHNQARVSKPLDPGTVARYVAVLANGETFPAIISAESTPEELLLTVDGNHRFAAYLEFGAKEVDSYTIVGASPAAITLLTFEANTKHGLPTSETDRIHQALYLMDSGITAEDAARRLGLRVSAVRTAANLAAVNRRATEAGIPRVRWDKLPAGVRHRLSMVSTDEGFAAAAKLTLDAGLGGEAIARAVNDLKDLKSSAKQVEYVKALRQTHATDLQVGGAKLNGTQGGRQAQSPRTKFGMTLSQLGTLPSPEAIIERMTQEEKPEWIARTTQAINRLTEIRRALQQG